MAVKTTLEQLEEVQSAITEVMTSQEMGGLDSRIVRARLKDLTDREGMLLKRYRVEQGTGGTPRANVAIPKRTY